MQLFINKKNSLANLGEKFFKLEKEIQSIFESNLEVLTGQDGNLLNQNSQSRLTELIH